MLRVEPCRPMISCVDRTMHHHPLASLAAAANNHLSPSTTPSPSTTLGHHHHHHHAYHQSHQHAIAVAAAAASFAHQQQQQHQHQSTYGNSHNQSSAFYSPSSPPLLNGTSHLSNSLYGQPGSLQSSLSTTNHPHLHSTPSMFQSNGGSTTMTNPSSSSNHLQGTMYATKRRRRNSKKYGIFFFSIGILPRALNLEYRKLASYELEPFSHSLKLVPSFFALLQFEFLTNLDFCWFSFL